MNFLVRDVLWRCIVCSRGKTNWKCWKKRIPNWRQWRNSSSQCSPQMVQLRLSMRWTHRFQAMFHMKSHKGESSIISCSKIASLSSSSLRHYLKKVLKSWRHSQEVTSWSAWVRKAMITRAIANAETAQFWMNVETSGLAPFVCHFVLVSMGHHSLLASCAPVNLDKNTGQLPLKWSL